MKVSITRHRIVIVLLIAGSLFSCSKGGPDPAPNPVTPTPTPGNSAAVYNLQGAGGACMNYALNGSYTQGTALTSTNTVNVQVNVMTPGTWSMTTNTVAGVSFSGSGSFATTGIQTINLNAAGTPSASGSLNFSLSAGASNCTITVPVTPPCDHCGITLIRGATFNRFSFPASFQNYGVSFSIGQEGWLLLDPADNGQVKARLVNADKGTLFISVDSYDLVDSFHFSNVVNFGAAINTVNIDTINKLQVWVYRPDGKDIIPASAGRPAINRIIELPGKVTGVAGSGAIIFHGYPGFPFNVNLAYLVTLYANPKWDLTYYRPN